MDSVGRRVRGPSARHIGELAITGSIGASATNRLAVRDGSGARYSTLVCSNV